MGKKIDKTNAMRILDSAKVKYTCYSCNPSNVNAVDVAKCLGADAATIFKTLVTVGKSGENYVFIVPAAKELDLKKAAKAANEKSLDMLPQKELFSLTGYMHGGCSPVGMKKRFKSFIDSTAENLDDIYISGGRVGCQIRLPLTGLKKAIHIHSLSITKET